MVRIELENIEPLPMLGAVSGSEVWGRETAFAPGERVLVKARSGQGKSTLLSILYGLRRDYRGRARVEGVDLRTFGPNEWHGLRRDRFSMVFQDLQLFEELTAWQNIELKNRLTSHRPEGQVLRWMEALGIAGKCDRPAGELSRGQKQRVAIVRALCQPFQWLLLDEPFSHLDQETGRAAAELIQAECDQQGAGWILASLEAESRLPCGTIKEL